MRPGCQVHRVVIRLDPLRHGHGFKRRFGVLGSTRVSHVGESVPLSRAFERRFRRDTETNTRDTHSTVAQGRQCAPQNTKSPLKPMTMPERVKADYDTMDLTTGPHPMKLLRHNLANVWRASDLSQARHGQT